MYSFKLAVNFRSILQSRPIYTFFFLSKNRPYVSPYKLDTIVDIDLKSKKYGIYVIIENILRDSFVGYWFDLTVKSTYI